MSTLPLIHDLSLDDLETGMSSWGEREYRAGQIWQGLYHQLVASPHELTTLPTSLRQRLSETYRFTPLEPMQWQRSSDANTEKVLLALHDGLSIETVLMHYERRRTVCISTQVGCAMDCSFCATGQMGFQRNLSPGEIVGQVLLFVRRLKPEEHHLDNIVVMGMGEPFHNYDALARAIRILNHPQGLRFGARRITVSTVGLVPGIERFGRDFPQLNLAVSLHAATNDLRDRLVPINRRYPLERLLPACHAHVESTSRRLTFEWALIEGVNDGMDQAEALVALVRGLNCHINLIPLNPTSTYGERASSPDRIHDFAKVLSNHHVSHSIRVRRGIDIQAGCGQLAIRKENQIRQRHAKDAG
jgi:23S rRNA (adenine2503-C2)-methyltransferase